MKLKYAALLDLIIERIQASISSYEHNGGNRKGEKPIVIRLRVYKISFTDRTSTGPARGRSPHQYRIYKRRLEGRSQNRVLFSRKGLDLKPQMYGYESPTACGARDILKENAYSTIPPVDSIKDDAYKSALTPRDILKEIAYSNNPPVDSIKDDAYLITPIPPEGLLKEDEEDWNKEKEKEENKGKKMGIDMYVNIHITISNLENIESFIDKFSELADQTRYYLIIRIRYNEGIVFNRLGEVIFYTSSDPVVMKRKYTALSDLITSRLKAVED